MSVASFKKEGKRKESSRVWSSQLGAQHLSHLKIFNCQMKSYDVKMFSLLVSVDCCKGEEAA
jgi:hypothetical protein